MIVYKFGGALARSKRGLEALVRIMREAVKREAARARRAKKSASPHGALHGIVLVTSAIGHTTRYLARAGELAEEGRLREAEEVLDRILSQHQQLASALSFEREARLLEGFETISSEIGALIEGVAIVRELSARTRDAILASGERFAAVLVHALLEDREIHTRVLDAAEVMITDEHFGHAAPIIEEISARAQKYIAPLLRREIAVIVPGFAGATREGITTTMGSESSDLTATLLSAALGASEIVIWKILPGLYTADPELVKSPKLIRTLSFDEAEEMGRRGARVLFPSFAHPLASSDALLRIATPFSRVTSRHTVLARELEKLPTTPKPLALAIEEHLLLFRIGVFRVGAFRVGTEAGTHPDAWSAVRSRAILAWEAEGARAMVIRREDRHTFLREMADAGVACTEGPPIAAISLIVRSSDGSTLHASELFAQMARSLRAYALYATIPIGRSIVALVRDSESAAALQKLHRDLFEA